jgi:cyanate permease
LSGIALTAAKTAGPVAAGVLRTATGSYTAAVLAVAAIAALAAVAVYIAGSVTDRATDPRGGDRP